MASSVISEFNILPNYSSGLVFSWSISPKLRDQRPWVFNIELSPGLNDNFNSISGDVSKYTWTTDPDFRINKDSVLNFRLKLTTGLGNTTKVYYSDVKTPYGDLTRREFLIAKEVMRKEYLHFTTLAGKSIKIWTINTFGPKCTECLDPITGGVRDSKCKYCYGTSRNPAYSGPYVTLGTFTPVERSTQYSQDNAGMIEKRDFNIRAIGTPSVKTKDVVLDTSNGKFYHVQAAQVIVELRRIPIVQNIIVSEAPTSDIIYMLDNADVE